MMTAAGRFGRVIVIVVFLLHLPCPMLARQKHLIDRAREGPYKCGVLGPTVDYYADLALSENVLPVCQGGHIDATKLLVLIMLAVCDSLCALRSLLSL